MDREAFVHFLGGAAGGTAGTAFTCPLEVIKTRLQSSEGCSSWPSDGKGGKSGLADENPAKTIGKKSLPNGVRRIVPRLTPALGDAAPEVLPAFSSSFGGGYRTRSYMPADANSLAPSNFMARSLDVPGNSSRIPGISGNAGTFTGNCKSAVIDSCCRAGSGEGLFFGRRAMLLKLFSLVQYKHGFCQLAPGGQAEAVISGKPSWQTARRLKFVGVIFRDLFKNEGFLALYKGLGPNLIGVAPSKAVYFYVYSSSKRVLNDVTFLTPNSAFVHMVSAATGGFVAASAVNPIWLVKTRLQLDHGKKTARDCMKIVWKEDGLRGFYRGVTASYMGISETIIQFVLYEQFRSFLLSLAESGNGENADFGTRSKRDFAAFMCAGGTAKLIACMLTYPHEVVRTRLREPGRKYRGFWRTLVRVGQEGGVAGLYRGMGVQLMRTVPNTAVTMGVYELVVHLLSKI